MIPRRPPDAGRGKVVYGHDPEPTVAIRSTANGALLTETVSIAATLILEGEAVLVGGLDSATQAAMDEATAHLVNVPAVERQL